MLSQVVCDCWEVEAVLVRGKAMAQYGTLTGLEGPLAAPTAVIVAVAARCGLAEDAR
jgi:hypothetical protein